MAYDDSEALQPNSTYSLGGYTFELKVQNVHEPGEEEVVSVFAICRSPDGTRETVPMDFQAGTTVESWSVEANETEASVYVKVKNSSPIDGVTSIDTETHWVGEYDYPNSAVVTYENGANFVVIIPSAQRGTVVCPNHNHPGSHDLTARLNRSYTYNGKTVYYYGDNYPISWLHSGAINISQDEHPDATTGAVAWTAIYPSISEHEEKLIARFAIDIREADGGPDGDWDEPGDTGDPSYTLNVSVTGASSGSNNGTPLEPGQTGGYGNGGIGGNGGGGGAGASTVIIYEFATDKAGTVNQEATAQGPGTGGPGGKGGKGGDGCILIFY